MMCYLSGREQLCFLGVRTDGMRYRILEKRQRNFLDLERDLMRHIKGLLLIFTGGQLSFIVPLETGFLCAGQLSYG